MADFTLNDQGALMRDDVPAVSSMLPPPRCSQAGLATYLFERMPALERIDISEEHFTIFVRFVGPYSVDEVREAAIPEVPAISDLHVAKV